MRHVTLFLHDGSQIRGIIPPVFWVVEGTRKATYPEDNHTLCLIQEPHCEEVLPLFDRGEMLFSEMPQGYREFQVNDIERIEVHVKASAQPVLVEATSPQSKASTAKM